MRIAGKTTQGRLLVTAKDSGNLKKRLEGINVKDYAILNRLLRHGFFDWGGLSGEMGGNCPLYSSLSGFPEFYRSRSDCIFLRDRTLTPCPMENNKPPDIAESSTS